MTTKKTKFLMMFVVTAIAATSGVYTIGFVEADADDINKGIGTTEVWEPGPDDGITFDRERPFDANKRAEYRDLEKSQTRYEISDSKLLVDLEKIRNSNIPIVASAIDYEIGLIVIYSPETILDSDIESVIGETPYIVIERDWDALRNPWNKGPPHPDTMDPKVDSQSIDESLFQHMSSWNIIQFVNADAATDNWYGTHIDNDVSTYDGAYAKIEVHDSGITLPSDVTLFGSTLMPNSKSGLEIAIRYTDGSYEFTVFDHYAESFTVEEDMDSTWMNTYTNTIGSNDFIYVEVLENQGAWIAKIYNYDTPGWETVDSQIFDGDREDGWSIWEEDHLAGQCGSATIPEIITDLVQIRDGSTWYDVTDTYGSLYDSGIPCNTGTMNTDYFDWDVS